jgi:hypothetical protein
LPTHKYKNIDYDNLSEDEKKKVNKEWYWDVAKMVLGVLFVVATIAVLVGSGGGGGGDSKGNGKRDG